MERVKTLFEIFEVTAIITHLWTVIIAFGHGGFLAGIISLFLPVLSELFWMIKMFTTNPFYSVIALIHLILALILFPLANE